MDYFLRIFNLNLRGSTVVMPHTRRERIFLSFGVAGNWGVISTAKMLFSGGDFFPKEKKSIVFLYF